MVPTKVHLVGSIALDSVEDVFRTVGSVLGRRLRRVPDGEPGGRRLWISWQYPLLRSLPFLKPAASQANQTSGFLPLQLADGVAPGAVRFPELGYAREARASYQDFLAARQKGDLPRDVRFQVSLPTPLAVINPFVAPNDALPIERAYEDAMLREVETVCRAIPHSDLCIQWDVCIEMVMWDGRWPFIRNPFQDLRGEIEARMKRLAAAVPNDVELGFHLCYGDWEAEHFVEPADAGKLTEFANLLASVIDRPITYVHMPVASTDQMRSIFDHCANCPSRPPRSSSWAWSMPMAPKQPGNGSKQPSSTCLTSVSPRSAAWRAAGHPNWFALCSTFTRKPQANRSCALSAPRSR